MTFLNHNNNLLILTLYFPLPPSNVASSAASALSTGQSTESVKSLSDKIKSEIDRVNGIKKPLEDGQNSQNDYLTEEENKRLSDCESKLSALETVHKLAEFADELDTKKHNDNNILNNLCSGLETFLGFNSTSKGYNGTGIVYSDLDRLCDAVMGFLSGVLSAVKNENEVTTYDKYITDDTKKLESVLDTLTNKIGSGREGLVDAVGAVREWLEGYEEKLNEKINAVKNPINNLENELERQKQNFEKLKNKEYDNAKNSELAKCISHLDLLPIYYNKANEYLKHLDPEFSGKLTSHVNIVLQVANSFVDHAKRDHQDLSATCTSVDGYIDEVIEQLNITVNHHVEILKRDITDEIDELDREVIRVAEQQQKICIDSLRKAFEDNIRQPIHKATDKLVRVHVDMGKWIDEAGILLGSAIMKACDVYIQLDPGEDNKPIGAKIQCIHTAQTTISKVNDALGIIDMSLEQWINTAEQIVRDAIGNVESIVTRVQKEKTDIITAAVSKLKQQAQSHFLELKKKQIEVLTHNANEHLGKLASAVETLVEQHLREMRLFYQSVIENTGSRLVAHASQRVDTSILQNSTQALTALSNAVHQAATELSGHHSALHPIAYRLSTTKSTHSTLEALITELQDQKFQNIRNILDHSNLPKDTLTASTHLATLTNYVDAIKDTIRASVNVLNEQIKNGLSAMTATMSSQNFSQLTTALNNSSNFAVKFNNQSTRQLQSRIRHQVNRNVQGNILLMSLSDIQGANSALSDIASQIRRFDAEFTAGQTFFKDFERTISEPFNDILQTIRNAVGEDQGLQKHLKSELQNTCFKASDGSLISGKNASINQIKNDLTTQKNSLSAPIESITQGVEKVKLALKSLRAKLKSEVAEKNNGVIGKMNNLLTDGIQGKGQWRGTLGLTQVYNDLTAIIGNTRTKNTLMKIIHDAYTLYNSTISNQVTACITEIKQTLQLQTTKLRDTTLKTTSDRCQSAIISRVTAESSEAKKNLKQSALKLFAKRITAELEEIRTLVSNQNSAIDDIINISTASGIRGLFWHMKTHHATLSQVPGQRELKEASDTMKFYFEYILEYIKQETKTQIKPLIRDHNDKSEGVYKMQTHIHHLLGFLALSKHFDHAFHNNLDDLQNALDNFAPKKFGDLDSPLLAPLKAGLAKFAEQLGHAYVSRYSGKHFNGALTKKEKVSKPSETGKPEESEIDVLTPEGRNCAKVCLTIVEMVYGGFLTLKKQCNSTNGAWRDRQINTHKNNGFGRFFEKRGFKVPSGEGIKQDGQLRCSSEMTGETIYRQLINVKPILECNTHLKECASQMDVTMKFNLMGILACFYKHLDHYNDICHLSTLTSKKQPCSAYEMLCWLSGLPHTPVYSSLLPDALPPLLESEKPTKDTDDDLEIDIVDHESLYINTCSNKIKYSSIHDAVERICLQSYDVITSIAGYGDEYTVYACDVSSNYLKLSYPADPSQCLDSLLDVLRRLFPVLEFLRVQCNLSAAQNGWSDCKYGRDARSAKWQCNEHPTDQPTGQPNDEPKCQPKSPLMSYLNDCLPGHLPHQLKSIGCKADCKTCPESTPGMPCITPLGFRGFSGSTKTGKDLCKVLTKFFDDVYLTSLLALSPTPPATLPEHFGFAMSLSRNLNSQPTTKGLIETVSDAFESRISMQSIGLYQKPYEFTKSIVYAYGSDAVRHNECEHQHLRNLTINGYCWNKKDKTVCVPFLSSTCKYYYEVLANKHANLYLSWAIYLPWTFWDLLNNLYNAFCSINCQDWGCRGCLRGDKCKKGEHGVVDEEKKSAICQCRSIVDCKGVSPTLYQFGFVFGEASTLNDNTSPKRCSDFCSQLKNVVESQYFKELFKQCDNFLWIIRQPFSYLVLALWLLSFLYLLHIMVIRLDLLHIKSHLHSPSSHRIAAQSLLAAARVNKLNRVFYLQP